MPLDQMIPSLQRRLRPLLLTTLGLATLAAPGIGNAAIASLSLRDTDGLGIGADVFFSDGPTPGEVSITIDSVGPEKLTPDLLGFRLAHEASVLGPLLTATGADVGAAYSYPKPSGGDTDCRCNLLVDLGPLDVFALTGLTSTTLALTHPERDVPLSAFDGARFLMILGLDDALFDDEEENGDVFAARGGDGGSHDDGPGLVIDGVRVFKLEGTITVIPEPSTALLMALGLMGLAAKRERR